MLPNIGITTQIIRRSKWYKEIDSFGFNTIEINRQNSKLYFDPYFLEKVKRYTRGYDLSIHSGTKGIFHSHGNFTKANLAVLIAEIDLCSMLGAKQLVFHLNNKRLTTENEKRLRDAIDYAKGLSIRMMYESDSRLVACDAYKILESFSDVGYVFDLGHFNNGIGNNNTDIRRRVNPDNNRRIVNTAVLTVSASVIRINNRVEVVDNLADNAVTVVQGLGEAKVTGTFRAAVAGDTRIGSNR